MSFMSGSDCATGVNPLAQMAKQQSMDRSLQHEHMRPVAGPGPSSMRSSDRTISQSDQQRLQEMSMRSNAFRFDDIRQELPRVGPSRHVGTPWASEFSHQPPTAQGPETAQGPAAHQPLQGAPQEQWASEFGPQMASQMQQVQMGPSMGPMQGMSGAYRMSPMYTSGLGMTGAMGMSQIPVNGAQSHQVKPLDNEKWEEQFKQFEDASNSPEQQTGPETESSQATGDENVAENVAEPAVANTFDEKELSVEDMDDPAIQEWLNTDLYPPGWDDVWDRIKGDIKDDGTYQTRGGPEIPMDAGANVWDRDFTSFASSRPDYADYAFAKENPYTNESDPFAMGVALMDQGAKLSIAALCFEAALQRNPKHVEAWQRLGDCQAQNEVEDIAIHALERAVKLDPSNVDALMSLAVSYTNEGYENAASATLERWIATKYPQLIEQAQNDNPALAHENRLQLHNRVASMFLKAAQLSPDGASMDADVQVGLGVLFYRNEDYTKAVDCFRAALSVRPDDALLWNRLGATLANASRPEEAIDAYYQALKLRPSFVRARCNLGVSCINIGCYKEASEHLLSALSLHETSEGDSLERSTNLLETLRRVFLAMDRRDLLAKVGPGMRLDDFRNEFQF